MQRVGWVQALLKPRKYVDRTFLYLVSNECMFNECLCGCLVRDLLLCELVVGFWQRSLAHSHSTSNFLEMGQLLRYCASPSNILFFMMLVPAPSDCFSELRDIKISWLPQGSGSLPWGAPPLSSDTSTSQQGLFPQVSEFQPHVIPTPSFQVLIIPTCSFDPPGVEVTAWNYNLHDAFKHPVCFFGSLVTS